MSAMAQLWPVPRNPTRNTPAIVVSSPGETMNNNAPSCKRVAPFFHYYSERRPDLLELARDCESRCVHWYSEGEGVRGKGVGRRARTHPRDRVGTRVIRRSWRRTEEGNNGRIHWPACKRPLC